MIQTRTPQTKCIVFDIDDTLYLERDYVQSGFRAVGEWILEAFGVSSFFEEAWKTFESGRRGDIFNVALERLEITPSDELIKTLLLVYRAHHPAIRLLADSENCLQEIAGNAFLGIISDGAVMGQQRKVHRLALASICDRIILTESLGVEYCKPHPRAFLEMQQASSCPPSACVYVADNPIKDFAAPNRLGWQTIRVRRPGGLHSHLNCSEDSQPSLQVTDLSQVPSLLLAR